jgi:mono/diheme cytochrome c family protein
MKFIPITFRTMIAGAALRTSRTIAPKIVRGGLGILLASAVAVGCGGPQGDGTGTATEALTATISGTISDAQGRPLNGVTVRLNGRTQATATTGAPGTYAFPLNVPDATASWSVMPARNGCTFNPSVANLSNVNGNRVANFTGTGAACVGVAQQNTIVATDPGPRPGAAGAGAPLPGLGPQEVALFTGSQQAFEEVDSVSGDGVNDGTANEDGRGLGPTFNGNSCAMCHGQPTTGGTSPGLASPQRPMPNPQIALATLRGATNVIPSFISATSPAREARFPIAAGGGVAGLFTISGRNDAPGCTIAQPNFAAQVASGDIIFRIATPTYGLGLVENTPDLALQANLAANAAQKAALGISGRLNTSGNDGTITKFGWKAQNKSLTIFAGEAYNVEQGISNEVFTNERSAVPGCVFNGSPEDHTNNGAVDSGDAAALSSDTVLFSSFMRFLAPPTPAAPTASTTNGLAVFNAVGCASCHTPSLTSGPSPFAALNNVTYSPFSDIAIHNMGTLADRVPQGAAAADEFRTAPLWGVGQRLFFLHDGRTADIVDAIRAHSSAGSEGNTAVANLAAQSPTNQQDLVNFLRSL